MDIVASENVGCTTVAIHDTQAKMPAKFEFDHLIHPTTLDACFQGTFVPNVGSNDDMELTSVKSVYISADVPRGAKSEIVGYSTLEEQGFGLLGSVTMSDKNWSGPKIVLKGLKYKKFSHSNIGTVDNKQPWEIKKICSNIVWKPDVEYISQSQATELLAPKPVANDHAVIRTVEKAFRTRSSMIAQWMEFSGHKRPYQRVLEVSNGSTSLTLQVLEALGGIDGKTPCFSQYVFTDRDKQSWDDAQQNLKVWENRVEFKQFDMNRSPTDQDLETEAFDVVLAAEVSKNRYYVGI